MTHDTWLILLHQLLFQGMFFAKNLLLQRRLGHSIRGSNPEASLSIAFFVIFISVSLWLSLDPDTPASNSMTGIVMQATAVLLLLALSVIGLGMVHAMILREERYLARSQAAVYERYRRRVPRYLDLPFSKEP